MLTMNATTDRRIAAAGRLTVMIVDDDPDDCFFHGRAVRKAVPDIDVVTMNCVDDAIRFLRSDEHEPQVILLDINMPRKSGWDFLDELQALGSTGSLVVMLTSSEAPGDVRRASEHPLVTTSATKPLTPEVFSSLLERFLAR